MKPSTIIVPLTGGILITLLFVLEPKASDWTAGMFGVVAVLTLLFSFGLLFWTMSTARRRASELPAKSVELTTAAERFFAARRRSYAVVQEILIVTLAIAIGASLLWQRATSWAVVLTQLRQQWLAFVVLVTMIGLAYINQRILKVRVHSGLFGSNESEARELLSFVMNNVTRGDFSGGAGLREIDLAERREAGVPAAGVEVRQ